MPYVFLEKQGKSFLEFFFSASLSPFCVRRLIDIDRCFFCLKSKCLKIQEKEHPTGEFIVTYLLVTLLWDEAGSLNQRCKLIWLCIIVE